MERKMTIQHPGILFRDNVINELGITVTDAAALLKITRPALSNVLNGHADISPEMSLKISKVFGGSAEVWMNMQTTYNLDRLRDKIEKLDLQSYHAVK
ncbi:addiction module antidote protein, HigA family [Chitinophaga rupis]|uniref:Addiction module antidote protein, HigA family n=1 Tax=Chitinophaga rupis TaxID=573321 RepID=A0A1H8FMY7_9BACT|nr:HigA family addiction module antitoxin [Chitinophaga rupis]SEN32547.1 addiction module antidote protein, HigA family [Chitinophaga rupis]